MPELSPGNIDQISNDVRREEISFSHLLDDIIDHVCCDVEYEMQAGLDFSLAYKRVKEKMGSSRRLKEIQEETLYSVDSKYRNMKNTMKISGIAGTIIFGFASLFKIQHWPGAGILLTLGAIILALVFMPAVMGVLWKETRNRKKLILLISGFIAGVLFISGTLFKIQHWPVAGLLLLGSVICTSFIFLPALLSDRLRESEVNNKRRIYIIGTAGSIFYILGMLFKIQHWPSSAVLTVLGLLMLGIIAIPLYSLQTWKNEKDVSSKFIFLIIASLLVIVPGALVNLSLQNMYDAGFYPHLEQQQKLFEGRQADKRLILERYHDSLYFQNMELLDAKTGAVIYKIDNIQKQMVEAAEGEPGKPLQNAASVIKTGTGYKVTYKELSRPFHTEAAPEFLLPGSASRTELDALLSEYISYISTLVSSEESVKLKPLLTASEYLPAENSDEGNWYMMSALHSLEVLRNNILTVELMLLESITKR